MRYLPILDELFSSDTIIFLVIGMALALFLGLRMKNKKKAVIGFGIFFVIYAVCEAVSNIHTNFFLEIILLFAGTVGFGGAIGFLVSLIINFAVKKDTV